MFNLYRFRIDFKWDESLNSAQKDQFEKRPY